MKNKSLSQTLSQSVIIFLIYMHQSTKHLLYLAHYQGTHTFTSALNVSVAINTRIMNICIQQIHGFEPPIFINNQVSQDSFVFFADTAVISWLDMCKFERYVTKNRMIWWTKIVKKMTEKDGSKCQKLREIYFPHHVWISTQ